MDVVAGVVVDQLAAVPFVGPLKNLTIVSVTEGVVFVVVSVE